MVPGVPSTLKKFFSFLPEESTELLWQSFERTTIDAGKVLFNTGDEAGTVYFVIEGKLSVVRKSGFSQRSQIVAVLESGALVGESAVVEGGLRGATVMAMEDSILAALSKKVFAELEEKEPALIILLLKKIVSITALRLQKSSERLTRVL